MPAARSSTMIGPQTGNTFSQELRLTSPADQFFSYVVGAFYSNAGQRADLQPLRHQLQPGAIAAGARRRAAAPGAPATSTFLAAARPSVRASTNVVVFGQSTINFTDVCAVSWACVTP